MKTRRIIDELPELYRNFLPAFFKREIPVETGATCMDCAMVRGSDAPFPGGVYFSKKRKCCTYYPELPNYMVGAILTSTGSDLAEGRNRVRLKIKKRICITPLGIARPKKYTFLLKNAQPEFFGRSKTLVCPFFDKGKGICTIRPLRDAVCNTWFCKYEAGNAGENFWRALRRYLENTEKLLTRYALYTMGCNPACSGMLTDIGVPLTLDELDERSPSVQSYRALWGSWAGKEEEFYKEAYQIISALGPKGFSRIEGISQKMILRDVMNMHITLISSSLPKNLKRNPRLIVEKVSDDTYFLVGYSALDPLQVTKRVYDSLDFFDGKRSNKEACRCVLKHLDADLSEDLLMCLYQFQILVDSTIEGKKSPLLSEKQPKNPDKKEEVSHVKNKDQGP